MYLDAPPGMGAKVHNRDEVIAVIRDAGLPYEVVPNILSLTFEEQVRLRAGCGNRSRATTILLEIACCPAP
jgi:hypothetical protein